MTKMKETLESLYETIENLRKNQVIDEVVEKYIEILQKIINTIKSLDDKEK